MEDLRNTLLKDPLAYESSETLIVKDFILESFTFDGSVEELVAYEKEFLKDYPPGTRLGISVWTSEYEDGGSVWIEREETPEEKAFRLKELEVARHYREILKKAASFPKESIRRKVKNLLVAFNHPANAYRFSYLAQEHRGVLEKLERLGKENVAET